MKSPLVSIVIPSFNSKDLIENCLKSVCASKYSNYEVLIVDDYSTDGSYELLIKKYALDPRIKIIRNEMNSGPSKTRNKGIRNALGKYIAFIETDMEVDPNWLTPLVRALEGDKYLGAVQSKTLDINRRDKIHSLGVKFNPHTLWVISPGCGFDKDWNPDGLEMGIGSVGSVVRKDVIDRIGGFDEKITHNIDDLDLGWRIWLTGYKIRSIPKSITYHWTGKPYGIREKITPKFSSELHFYKGHRLIVKNYELRNVLYYLPWQMLAYSLNVVRNLFLGNFVPLRAYITAIFWNFSNIRNTIEERGRIQRLRKRTDREMFNKLCLPENFFQFYFGTMIKNLLMIRRTFGKDYKKGKKVPCLICGYKMEEVFDNYAIRASDKFYYKICHNCTGATLLPRPKKDDIVRSYNKEYFSNLSVPFTNPIFQWLLTRKLYSSPNEWIKKNFKKGKILDVGCGNGEFLDDIKKDDWEVWGSDLSNVAKANTEKKIGKGRVKLGDFSKQILNQRFQYVSFWHVLEHVIRINSYLSKAYKILNKNGYVIGEVPNFDSPWISIFNKNYAWMMTPVHINYFSKKSLKFLLNKSGFRDIKIHTPPRALLNPVLSFVNFLKEKKVPKLIRTSILIGLTPTSIVFTLTLSLFERGEVLRFVAKKNVLN